MSFGGAFDAAADIVYQIFGEPAIYEAPGGAPVTVTVIRSTLGEVMGEGFLRTGVDWDATVLEVRETEIGLAVKGAKVTMGDECFSVVDVERVNNWEWRLAVR